MKWFSALLSSDSSEYLSLTRDRILIIEDDLRLQIEMNRVLKRVVPETLVDWATTAEEVKLKMDQKKMNLSEVYSLVISDIVLPGNISGFDFWKICQNDYPGLKIVLMSGMNVEEFLNQASGISRVLPPLLQKPYTLEDCQELVEKLMKKAG